MIELDMQKDNNTKMKNEIKNNLQASKQQKMKQLIEESKRLKEERKVFFII